MKNLSVGKKILTGFLVVILMIAIILGLTVVTSLTRNRDLERVSTMSDLQRNANAMLDNFNLARVEIRTLFTSIDAEAEYNLALEYMDTCLAQLTQLEALSQKLDGYHADELVTMREHFDQVRAAIVNVGTNDEMAMASLAAMQDSGSRMTNATTELFDLVTAACLNIGAEDPVAGLDRVEIAMVPAKVLGDTVDDVRVQSRVLMLQQDTSVVPDLYAGLDNVKQQAAAMRADLTTDAAREATDTVTSAVEGFRGSIVEVADTMALSEQEIAQARERFQLLTDSVNGFVEAITADVGQLNEGVIRTSQVTMLVLVAVGVAAVVFAVVVATLLGRIITRPLNKMKDVMLQAGETGNLNFTEEVKADIVKEAAAKDEIGQSLHAFTRLIDHITRMSDILGAVADKDLTVDVALLSESDTMGVSLKKMLANLNDMFAEINSIASQVATSANEVALGAQSLAQGSTEQASTVQEISASITEINEQMNTSSSTASEAARDSMQMSSVAQEGNQKMGQMTGSMQDINDASQAISQVIKVIDDIAFQTNILALNAAVEAARAGEHGKGFAVVADEVRNLAGKSADAAKETSNLISSNIEKTEQGMGYTRDTAESLGQIMEGIQKNSGLMQSVAEQAEGAKMATAQVTQAINQVAQVVQQNSATSEESAAASQEMSSQAQVLQQLIAQFKLKNVDHAPRELPPSAPDTGGGPGYDNAIVF